MGNTLEIKRDSIVYILCPANYKSGGPELLHQLCYVLHGENIKSTMCYLGEPTPNPVHEAFSKYVNSYCFFHEINDSEDNYLITPEIYFENFILGFKKLKIVPWWLSVDNYGLPPLKTVFYKNLHFIDTLRQIKYHFSKKGNGHTLTPKQLSLFPIHLSQSYYSTLFLRKSKISLNPVFLSDYINDSYLNVPFEKAYKRDIVVYNPEKGYVFTHKLIDSFPNITFVPLRNMSNEEVISTLLKAKVYIDFGNHPGKDRIPREAAILGCVLITNKKGSAKNHFDVPIPKKYKINDKASNIKTIGKMINAIFHNYDSVITDFVNYRYIIRNEKSLFIENIKKIFIKKY